MPLTQIALKKGKPAQYRKELMEQVYLAMRETIAIPEDDRFAIVTELDDDNFNNSGNYLGIERSEDVVFIKLTINQGRTVEKKQALYAAIAERLSSSPGVRPEDVVICINEVAMEDWSLGNGIAQYV